MFSSSITVSEVLIMLSFNVVCNIVSSSHIRECTHSLKQRMACNTSSNTEHFGTVLYHMLGTVIALCPVTADMDAGFIHLSSSPP